MFLQRLFIRVNRQLQPVKARMSLRVRIFRVKHHRLYHKPRAIPPISLQLLEPINRYPWRSRTELQKPRELGLIQVIHVVPEPLDDLMIVVKGPSILGVVPPVVQIDKRHPVHQHVEFIRLEDNKQFFRYNSMNSFFESVNVFLDGLCAHVVDTSLKMIYIRLTKNTLLFSTTSMLLPLGISSIVSTVLSYFYLMTLKYWPKG